MAIFFDIGHNKYKEGFILFFNLLDEDFRGEELKGQYTHEDYIEEDVKQTSFMDKHEKEENRGKNVKPIKPIKRRINDIVF